MKTPPTELKTCFSVAVSVLQVKQHSATFYDTTRVSWELLKVVICTGESVADRHHFMPLDSSKLRFNYALPLLLDDFGPQLVLCTARGALGKNMRLSKWPFPASRRDYSNWHFFIINRAEQKLSPLRCLCHHFMRNEKKIIQSNWLKVKYNIVSCALLTYVISCR